MVESFFLSACFSFCHSAEFQAARRGYDAVGTHVNLSCGCEWGKPRIRFRPALYVPFAANRGSHGLQRFAGGVILAVPLCNSSLCRWASLQHGARMKITYSNIHSEFRKAIEVESEHHIEKLKRLLKRYSPDLVLLHGSFEKLPRTTLYSYSLNLTLPTGTLHASGAGPDVRSSVRITFAEIELQVKKHQEKLRKDYVWKRKRGRGVAKLGELPAGRGEAAD
ncbi:MAG TPA: hypothetical protein VEG64_08240 [Candidatus Sulfotelmatobacter sp.]|nr:hypothetical protein [Candidatus Sulfotelmatobacter sp.]